MLTRAGYSASKQRLVVVYTVFGSVFCSGDGQGAWRSQRRDSCRRSRQEQVIQEEWANFSHKVTSPSSALLEYV